MPLIRIEVAAAAGAYPVVIGAGGIAELPQLLDQEALGPRRVIVSSPQVWNLHHQRLRHADSEDEPILVPDGERSKHLVTVGRVYEALVHRKADRATVVIAIGGGVIGDLVGFAAATYLRGIRLVQVPTTLMAQVDSAIGGKVGVNHTLGKNLIGAFHAPRLVVADPELLATLPRREFRAGLYEVIKYGIIASPSLFDTVSTTLPRLFAHDRDAVAAIVAESCAIKARVVSSDERESGPRRVLNFGHTLGHALESVTNYRRFRHGEAVAYGMLAALTLGVRRGVTEASTSDRVARLITTLGPLPPVADLSATVVVSHVARDKKVVDGTLHFVAATAIGATAELTDVREEELRSALEAIGLGK